MVHLGFRRDGLCRCGGGYGEHLQTADFEPQWVSAEDQHGYQPEIVAVALRSKGLVRLARE